MVFDEDLETGGEDPLFPSGPWGGYYVYPGECNRHRMDLDLRFAGGYVTGSGGDDIGYFTIDGRYDIESLEVVWIKTYPGSHDVRYRGFREGRGIWGTWSIDSSLHGGFRIWPRTIGEEVIKWMAESLGQPVLVPATVGAEDEKAGRREISRRPPPSGWAALLLVLLALASGCTSTPDATELPDPANEHEVVSEVEAAPEALPSDPEDPGDLPAGTSAAKEPLPVEPLTYKGVKGGEIQARLAATPEAVVARLLDFEQADGNRAWAKHHVLVSREPQRVVATWRFEGRMGVNPTAELVFDVGRDGDDHLIRYRQTAPVFGLAAFFGDYRVAPDPAAPGQAILTQRVFIDSGLWIANASREDIADGLREDVRLLAAWIAE